MELTAEVLLIDLLCCAVLCCSLWPQTLLLAVLLSSLTTLPLALHLTWAPQKWRTLLLELRCSLDSLWWLAGRPTDRPTTLCGAASALVVGCG